MEQIKFTDGTSVSSVSKTYDWQSDNGRENLGTWVEEAFESRTSISEEKKLDDGDKSVSRSISHRPLTSPSQSRPVIVNRSPAQPWCNV